VPPHRQQHAQASRCMHHMQGNPPVGNLHTLLCCAEPAATHTAGHSTPCQRPSWTQPRLTAHACRTATTNSKVLDNAITPCLPNLNQHYTATQGPLQVWTMPATPQTIIATASDSRLAEGRWWQENQNSRAGPPPGHTSNRQLSAQGMPLLAEHQTDSSVGLGGNSLGWQAAGRQQPMPPGPPPSKGGCGCC
jgi:hypothetical protein